MGALNFSDLLMIERGSTLHKALVSDLLDLGSPINLSHTSNVITLDADAGRAFNIDPGVAPAGNPFQVGKMKIPDNTGVVNIFDDLQQHDVIVAIMNNSSGGAGITGYSPVRDADNSEPQIWVGLKHMGATPDTTIDMTGTNNEDTILVAYRGVHQTSAEDATHEIDFGTSGAADFDPITPANDKATILAILAEGSDVTGGTVSNMDLVEENYGLDTIAVFEHQQDTAAAFDPAQYSIAAGSPDWKSITMALRSDGVTGNKNYTLNVENAPASALRKLHVEINVRDAGGVWTLPTGWKDIGTPIPFAAAGRYIAQLTVGNGEILSKYLGEIT